MVDVVTNPLTKQAATALAREIALNGFVEWTTHAADELEADDVDRFDVEAVLTEGACVQVQQAGDVWRYRHAYDGITLVIRFVVADHLIIITGWRND